MSDPLVLAALGFVAMFALMALHVPIGVAMGVVGAAGFAVLVGVKPALTLLASEPASVFTNLDLAVIPLFILMGSLAAAGGLASDVYKLAYAFIGHRRGGLALATIGGCGGFGAVCGSAIATTATFGRVALPEMLQRGYSPALAAGAVASGGTLGIIVPPSSIMVIYAVLSEQFIVDLFIAAIVPAIMAVLFYAIAVIIYVNFISTNAGPPGPRVPWSERWQVIKSNWGALFLATVVLGGIYSGIFTVNEAAAVGVTIALIFAIGRRKLTWKGFLGVLAEASAVTLMIYVMIIGASIFSYFMSVAHAPERIIQAVGALNLSGPMVVLVLLIIFLILGAIFDEVAAILVTMPFVLPLIQHFGYDLVWWGIINVTIVEIALLSPPIGLNVFVVHGMRKDIPLRTIYIGIVPFLFADLIRLALLVLFPSFALYTVHLFK